MQELDRTRASDAERDAAAERLQLAFADGRIDGLEFDERMRGALTARTRGDLAAILADLPLGAPPASSAVTPMTRPGRFAVSYKGSIRRAGRWQVPEHYTAVVYKGTGFLDLRAAELTTALTTIVAVAYKSRIDIAVPPGVRVEAGAGVSTGSEGADLPLPPGAPVVRIRSLAYKGTIEAASHPPATAQ